MALNLDSQSDRIVVGQVLGGYGVQGWIRVLSYTRPRGHLLSYSPWLLQQGGRWQARQLIAGKACPSAGPHKGLIVQLADITDRDAAVALKETKIAIDPTQLVELEQGRFYWRELMGLMVWDRSGTCMGRLTKILDSPAHDVLIVEGEQRYLIPYVWGVYVLNVDLHDQKIVVDWDKDATA